MNKIKKIYFVGIKGVGMASLAIIAKEAGMEVRGSDLDEEFITDVELEGITVDIGFEKSFLDEFLGSTPNEEMLVIATAAHGGFENLQVVYARELGIKVLSHGQAVGIFMDGEIFDREFIGISVAGAHGKTTSSAMAAVAFTKLNRDPTYTIGTSEVFPIGFGGHYGKGDYFIAEADEYFSELKTDRKPKFLYQNPVYLIINNIDFDHPDVYKNFDEIKYAYKQFANTDSIKTVFVSNDEKLAEIIPEIKKEIIFFGESEQCDYKLVDFQEVGLGSKFIVERREKGSTWISTSDFEAKRGSTSPFAIGEFELSVPGKHNALNALGVIALLCEIGVHPDDMISAIKEFQGTKRRLEKIGEGKDSLIIYDDYAHHPLEIKTSIAALKLAYPDKKLIVIFQAHTYSRTQSLMKEFGSAFEMADQIILLPIFPSARETVTEEEKNTIESDLISRIPGVVFLETFESVVKYVDTNIDSGSIVVTMGAGDVYKVAKRLKDSHG